MATQSLYRRYRPQRFSELRGQEHVVRALRDSIANEREGQAYLFSGPRGTGKTTTARIMAKALNCENLTNGEPCGECDSCKAVENGTSYDVHELDAASNNGVDAIRDLIEKASLGTPGRHKVYILDEVHMLSKGAEAALLKTLEEPPPHVVFVLATTDPQKMSDTIRSRTQHLQFHLLPAEELSDHIHWVAHDAGYELPESAFAAALERGGGSARDTLSALELIASTGGEVGEAADVEALLQALIDRDPAAALSVTATGVAQGLDPRAMTEDTIRHLRNAFLSLMAPNVVVMAPDRLTALSEKAREYGAPNLVRAIERLGATLTDMRNAPDPRVLVEVALVQLTSTEANPGSDQGGGPAATVIGGDLGPIEARLAELERRLEAAQTATQTTPTQPATPTAESPRDPETGRKVLGGAAERARLASDSTVRGDSPGPPADDSPPAQPTVAPAPTADRAVRSVTDAWSEVRSQLKPLVRALFSAGEMIESAPGQARFVVNTDAQVAKCGEHRADVARALSGAAGRNVDLEITTSAAAPQQPAARSVPSPDAAPTVAPSAPAGTAVSTPVTRPPADATPPAHGFDDQAPPIDPDTGRPATFDADPHGSDSHGSDPHGAAPGRVDAAPSSGAADDVTPSAPPEIHAEAGPNQAGNGQLNDPIGNDRGSSAPSRAQPNDEPTQPPTDPEFEPETSIDLDDLIDAPPDSYKSPLDKLAEAFPGSEMLEEDR